MTLISYAQNYEDVMLWRALRDVEGGTYLDIGAQDPILHSVSRAFYDAGWRGVHVEPIPRYAAALRAHRPDEQVIEALVGNQGGIATLFEIADTGLSTGIDAIAERHRAGGWEARAIQAPVVSLADLLDLFKGRDIHWMKIDVEGMEPDVLQSWGDHPARPWIVAIESVAPLSQVPSHEAWIGEMLERDYREVYFDGLNRFFVADARPQIADAFAAPPNVFDGFVVPDDHFTGALIRQQRDEAKSAGDAVLQEQLDTAEKTQGALREETASLELAVGEARERAEHARAELLDAQDRHASAEAELRAAHAEREAQLGNQLREAGAALQAAADRRADLHADFARRIEAAGAAHAEQIDRLAAAQAGRETNAARREAELSRSLGAAQTRIAAADAQLRDAGAALRAATDQRADLQAEFARRIEAVGAAHAEQIDRMATAQADREINVAQREADLSRSLDAAHARIAAADAQLGRAAFLLRKIEGSRGWRWTAPLRILANPRRAPALARQIASLAAELAGRAAAIGLATAPAAAIPATGENMDAATLQPPDPGIRATSLDELLALRDRTFVRSAYLTVLGREADPDGEAHHLYWLRRGVIKMQILGQLRRSLEGRAYDPGIAGLDRAIRRHRRRRIPLIGAILRGFGGGEGDMTVDRGFRALANEIGGLRDDQSMWMTQLIQTVDQRLLAPLPPPEPVIQPEAVPEPEAIDQPQAADAGQLAPRALEIHRRLASAR